MIRVFKLKDLGSMNMNSYNKQWNIALSKRMLKKLGLKPQDIYDRGIIGIKNG